MILTCLYLTGCGREEVPYLDTTQTQEQTVEEERTEQKETLKSDQTVQIYVCGEVAAPGVYQLKDGMRICDAVEAAGGLTKAASREYWNLAEKLSDGQMIYFPTEEEARERKASAEAAGASVQEESDGRIDINTADAAQLVALLAQLAPDGDGVFHAGLHIVGVHEQHAVVGHRGGVRAKRRELVGERHDP